MMCTHCGNDICDPCRARAEKAGSRVAELEWALRWVSRRHAEGKDPAWILNALVELGPSVTPSVSNPQESTAERLAKLGFEKLPPHKMDPFVRPLEFSAPAGTFEEVEAQRPSEETAPCGSPICPLQDEEYCTSCKALRAEPRTNEAKRCTCVLGRLIACALQRPDKPRNEHDMTPLIDFPCPSCAPQVQELLRHRPEMAVTGRGPCTILGCEQVAEHCYQHSAEFSRDAEKRARAETIDDCAQVCNAQRITYDYRAQAIRDDSDRADAEAAEQEAAENESFAVAAQACMRAIRKLASSTGSE